MSVGAWWPGATARPVRWSTAGGPLPGPVRGWILHVAVMSGSPWGVFDGSTSPGRKFSHLWIGKDGRAEQYAPLDYTSWAQGAGNADWWSVETEGYPTEQLTDAQLHTLAAWHVWSLTPDELAATPSGYGIGTHAMGGAAWGGHTCPDPTAGLPGPRSRQRPAILAAAQTIRSGGDMPITDADAQKIAGAVWALSINGDPTPNVTAGVKLDRTYRAAQVLTPQAVAAAVVAALPAGTLTADAVAKAVADVLAARLAQ